MTNEQKQGDTMKPKNPTMIGILAGLLGLIVGGGFATVYWLRQVETIQRLHDSAQAIYTLENLKFLKSKQDALATKFLEMHLDRDVTQLGKTYMRQDAYGPGERELLLRIKAYRDANPVTDNVPADVNRAATEILKQASK
ncbi:MAG: hypothetical protein IPP78_05520 [Holophagaceae bacterium]|nr:hypothetical protein [Holophagaceae bacterium]